jgi:hypothetical protein
MMKIIKNSDTSGNYIVTTVVGDKYLNSWKEFALPSWEKYANKYDLGLIIVSEELISDDHPKYKKIHWQKLLILSELESKFDFVINICLLDSDILINPFSPNIFDGYKEDSVALISKRKNLPFPYHDCMKRISFFRHKYYSERYPLDSAIFISTEDLYLYHDLAPQADEACTGVMLFNVKNHASLTKKWFYKYESDVDSITNGGEQTHVNYEIQSNCKVQWLDYKFQAIWVYEMAWKYPFLYENSDKNIIKNCIESSLLSNYFLHFAGSWHESQMWKTSNVFSDYKFLEEYSQYLDSTVSGKPLGMIKP